MFKIIILFIFVVYATADNSVTLGCQMCQGHVCLTLKGGPFQDMKIPSKEKSCSQVQVVLPVTYDFKCQSTCSDGCLMTVIQQQSRQSICTSKAISQIALNELDMLYNIQMHDQTMQSKYDWCGCPKQLPQQLPQQQPQQTSESNYLGIFILLMVAAAGVGVFFLLRKKKQQQKRFPTSEAILVLEKYNQQ